MSIDYRRKPRNTTTISPIAAQRIASGLTQTELAKRIGVAPQQIGAWERGERNPKLDALIRISDALSCDLNSLIQK